MKARGARFLFGALSLLAVVVLLYADLDRAAPGPLSPVHALRPELQDPAGCDRCHGSWTQSMASACAECHEDVQQELDSQRGFHGTLAKGSDCDTCHLEHHGQSIALVTRASFAQAGFAQRSDYDHRGIDWGLSGRHRELSCDQCHERADVRWIEEGQSRFGGAPKQCAACHEDVHEGRFGTDCAQCHGQERPFAEATEFEHPERFPLEGVHAGIACSECHSPDEVQSLDEPREGPTRTCAECHDSPHRARFLLATSRGCEACHPTGGGPFAQPDLAAASDWHAATGFALEPPHQDVECAQCHADPAPEDPAPAYRRRFPGRRAADCAACHEDPHGGQFDDPAPRACTDCHAPTHFEPPEFGPEQHAATAFPLEDAHARAECAACHEKPDPDGPRVFAGRPHACQSCHQDAHDGAFDLAATEAPLAGCARCHRPTTFDDELEFDHGAWTAFPLEGAHARALCESCHPRASQPDSAGRRFGRAAQVFGQPVRECATCHADPHEGSFAAAAPAPSGLSGRTDCAACHDSESFDRVASFDHGAWTGFELRGAHQRADCAACHGQSSEPDAQGRTLGRCAERFPGPRDRCSTCHADVHRGAFERPGTPRSVAGRVGCARCHDEESFREVRIAFDHGRFTGFALEGAHAQAECAACHPRLDAPRESARPFADAAGTRCSDCHEDPHAGQFAQDGRPADCARCHPAGAHEFTELDFDHSRRFALDSNHARLACSACHRPWPLADGRRVVRYRPLGTRCSDCHGAPRPRNHR